jgi:hypothetical protein
MNLSGKILFWALAAMQLASAAQSRPVQPSPQQTRDANWVKSQLRRRYGNKSIPGKATTPQSSDKKDPPKSDSFDS